MRHAAKRDANEPEIVRALELAGWTVIPISDTGVMDLLCIRRGVIRLLEVKGPKGKLTPAQEKTFARINAAGGTVHVVRTPAEALRAVALGVESELGPLWNPIPDSERPPRLSIERIREAVARAPKAKAHHRCPVHPGNYGLLAEGIAAGVFEMEDDGTVHVVTPAYQKAQTEAVVPKRRAKA